MIPVVLTLEPQQLKKLDIKLSQPHSSGHREVQQTHAFIHFILSQSLCNTLSPYHVLESCASLYFYVCHWYSNIFFQQLSSAVGSFFIFGKTQHLVRLLSTGSMYGTGSIIDVRLSLWYYNDNLVCQCKMKLREFDIW